MAVVGLPWRYSRVDHRGQDRQSEDGGQGGDKGDGEEEEEGVVVEVLQGGVEGWSELGVHGAGGHRGDEAEERVEIDGWVQLEVRPAVASFPVPFKAPTADHLQCTTCTSHCSRASRSAGACKRHVTSRLDVLPSSPRLAFLPSCLASPRLPAASRR